MILTNKGRAPREVRSKEKCLQQYLQTGPDVPPHVWSVLVLFLGSGVAVESRHHRVFEATDLQADADAG